MDSRAKFRAFGRRVLDFCRRDGLVWVLAALLLAFNIGYMLKAGIYYSLESDDLGYINSGIVFKNEGIFSIHNEYRSAQIMPGMPVILGGLAALFGEGDGLWLSAKLLFSLFGAAASIFIYKSVRLFAPWWAASVSVLPLFLPGFVRSSNLAMTETPYIFFCCMLLYYTLMMGRSAEKKYAWWWLISFMLALMIRANIISYPVFAALYLLLCRTDWRMLLKRAAVLAVALLCFVVPWSIRNYNIFHEFIPLTYGAGDAILLGTYQGRFAPGDEEMDYETNVDSVILDEYAEFFNEDGTEKPEYWQYVFFARQSLKAKYRIREWLKDDPLTFLFTFIVLKPYWMIRDMYCPRPIPEPLARFLSVFQTSLFFLGAIVFLASMLLKKHRKELIFLASFFVGTLYIHACSFASGRYSFTLLPALFIAVGIGLSILSDFIREKQGKKTA